MAIAGAVVLLVILVVLGGYFFYRSLPGNAELMVPSESSASATPETAVDDMKVLSIGIVGESSDVLVRVPGGEVLINATMDRGQHVSYAKPRMDVTLGDPTAVKVYVNGEPKNVHKEEPGYTFTAVAE